MPNSVIVINTGSTSTKLAYYRSEQQVAQQEYRHSPDELSAYPYMHHQLPMRQALARQFVAEVVAQHGRPDAFVARGGILPPIHSGGYVINQAMLDYLENICQEEHASNLAAPVAHALAAEFGIKDAYIYDGITTDELEPIARISGIPALPRTSLTHALNMRSAAIRAAKDIGRDYRSAVMIVAHLGGGISLSLHKNGRMVDKVGDDEGPFSPERAGGQQCIQLIRYMHNIPDLRDKLRIMRGQSGLVGYCGTNDARAIEDKAAGGDAFSRLMYDAMAYQIAKSIGELATVVCGGVDCIVLTGGLARSAMLTDEITRRVSFIAPVRLYPGEDEMRSLALGALRILSGEEAAREFVYTEEPA